MPAMIPGANIGNTGIGQNFARARLLLAKRAGYLPDQMQLAAGAQGATQQWQAVSKNLAKDSRSAGFSNPMMFLRQGAQQGRLQGRQMPNEAWGAGGPYANSQLFSGRVDPRMLLRYFMGA